MAYLQVPIVAIDRPATERAELVMLPMGTLLHPVGDDYYGVALRVADTDEWCLTGYPTLWTSADLVTFASAWRVLGALVDDEVRL